MYRVFGLVCGLPVKSTPTSIQAAGGSVFGEAGLMPHIEQLWACIRKEVRREMV